MTFHDGKPVEKESCQRQPVSFRSLSSDVTQPAFRQGKHNLRLETLHRLLQRVIGCQGPDKIFIVGNPRSKSPTESALSQSMNKIWQPQLRVYH
jgi:hypothetical protein